jgi:hypothetical protein
MRVVDNEMSAFVIAAMVGVHEEAIWSYNLKIPKQVTTSTIIYIHIIKRFA